MKKNLFFLCTALLSMLWCTSCKEPVPQELNVQLIKSISIKNTTYVGEIDTTTWTITFNDVAAETNIEAIEFTASMYVGAKLDQTIYDFTQGASEDGKQLVQTIKATLALEDKVHEQEYTVIINLLDPASDPMLDKLVMKKGSDGTEVTAQIIDGVLALGMPEETEATLVSITLIPARANYKFTAMQNDKLTADNAGQLEIEFMGRKTVMDITFKSAPTPGVDIAAAVIHDFSVATGNAPDAFAAENTRGTDFDGEHVLVVARSADGTAAEPHLYKVSDLLADNASNRINLNVTGVEGGTHIVSSGSLNHGHIYICNLTTGIGDELPLKIYHYADANAAPEVWSWNGDLGTDADGFPMVAAARLGDNISVNIDESGNGFAFFCGQEGSAEKMYRVQITNFNQFSNPTEIILSEPFPYYGYVNQVPEAGQYVFKSHYMAVIRLMDAEGVTLMEDIELDVTENGLNPRGGLDPHVILFNRGRYLVFATPYNNGKRIGSGPGLFVQDITEGVDTKAALIKWSELLYDEEYLWEPTYHYSLDPSQPEANTTVGACAAQCNAAEVDGKLVVFAAATKAGFVLIEFPKAK